MCTLDDKGLQPDHIGRLCMFCPLIRCLIKQAAVQLMLQSLPFIPATVSLGGGKASTRSRKDITSIAS
jgi:hypothetical protein